MDLLSLKRRALGHFARDNWGGSSSNEGGSSTSTSGAGPGSTGGGGGTSLGGISPDSTLTTGSTVADAAVTDQSAAETSRLARMETFAEGGTSGGYFGGGIASAGGGGVGPEVKAALKGAETFVKGLLAALGFIANPVLGIAKVGYANIDKLGQANPYGPSEVRTGGGGAGVGVYTSALPSPSSFAAQQRTSAPAFSTSYLATSNNAAAGGTKTQSQGGAVAALAVLATLVLAT